MRKQYSAPTISIVTVQLGVYGDYGNGDGGGDTPDQPIKIIDRFNMHMD